MSQQRAVLGQLDAALAADKQRGAQFLLQVTDLAGEGGLGHMQDLGSTGDVFFLRHGQKIAQRPQFHRGLLSETEQAAPSLLSQV